MMNVCETCGERRECSQCHGLMAHVHFKYEPAAWLHTKHRPAEPTVQKPRKPHYELLTKEQQDWLDAATPAEPTVQEEKP